MRPRVAAQGELAAPPAEGAEWSGALAALATLLAERGTPGAELSVVLSGRFARTLVLPWPQGIEDDEGEAYAAHQFRRVFGEPAGRWKVCYDTEAAAGQRLACAVAPELLAALGGAAGAARMRLVSVQPLLAAAFNQCRREIGRDATLFVLAEPGRYYGAALAGGAWQGLRQGPLADDSAAALAMALEREAALCADERTRLVLYAPEHAEPQLGALAARVQRFARGAGAPAYALGGLA